MKEKQYVELEVPVSRPWISSIPDLTYSQVKVEGYGEIDLKMDILKPVTEHMMPAVLYVTGGRFLYCKKENNIQTRVRLAEAGYVVASIHYRTAPVSLFPAPVEDVKSAVRYLRANAGKFNIDATHIGLWGESAGGYMVTMAGTTNGTRLFDVGDNMEYSSDVAAVVDLYGVTALDHIASDFSKTLQKQHALSPAAPEALFLYGADANTNHGVTADPHKLSETNPMGYITDKTPPFLIMHGGRDDVMSVAESELLYEALQKQAIPSTFYYVKNAQHSGVVWEQEPIVRIIVDFFDKYLK